MSTRIKSAAVAIVIAVIAVILHDTFIFELVVGFITGMAVYEMFKATGAIAYKHESYACLAFVGLDTLSLILHRFGVCYFFSYRLCLGLMVMAMCILFLRDHNTMKHNYFFSMMGITVLFNYSFNCIIELGQNRSIVEKVPEGSKSGAQIFLLVLTLASAWLADSGAYFVGTFFSKSGRPVHHPWPEISPNKTLEGLAGGVICNGIFTVIIAFFYDVVMGGVSVRYFMVFFAGMLCALVGLVGDLTASAIKRQTGIKDYGSIMPGHGGVMDRFDSVLLVAPFMYYLIYQGAILK